MGIQDVAGQQCDSETNATLVDTINEVQPVLECLFNLIDNDNFTFENDDEYEALDDLASFNESAFDAIAKGNCSAL